MGDQSLAKYPEGVTIDSAPGKYTDRMFLNTENIRCMLPVRTKATGYQVQHTIPLRPDASCQVTYSGKLNQ